ncbi:MAG: rRNA (guanine745-N1)-methyltransferase [Verrucomicrobiota bacterium]|nr:rRNA (guanine745-N1)-methyltransferase [Verrucomicrobiota bacterium]MDK2964029.1 rRNA (guanine745-N1)-methyltransferase [Verrucomicrobiota bacterium]
MNSPAPHSEHVLLRCPVCGNALSRQVAAYRCEKGHSFDPAKEDYLNLLLSHQRKSKHPGDGKEMIQARRRFFDSGAFDPLTDLILSSSFIAQHPSLSVLDAGCGEGHISGMLSETCSGQFFGIDISKDAIRCAAKRYKKTHWIVANLMRDIPLADRSMDVILSLLAPRNPDEFARIMKPGGILIIGVPGPDHLIELRSELMANAGDFEEKADEAVLKCAPLFIEQKRRILTYEKELSRDQLSDLIQMTPIFWNSGPAAKKRLQQLPGLTVTISFTLLSMKKIPS